MFAPWLATCCRGMVEDEGEVVAVEEEAGMVAVAARHLQRLQRETADVRVVGAARPRALEQHFERAHPHQIRLHL